MTGHLPMKALIYHWRMADVAWHSLPARIEGGKSETCPVVSGT